MIRQTAGIVLAAFITAGLRASQGTTYVIPVVTAQVNGRVYTTTFGARNQGVEDATCEAIYAVPTDPKGATLRATYTIPGGGAVIVEDLLMGAGAVGTMRIACSAPITAAARVQASTDGGRTFDQGRTYPQLDEADAFRDRRTVRVASDLLVAEVAGNAVAFEAVARNETGDVLGRKTYDLPGFAHQIVNLSTIRRTVAAPRVEIRVIRGDGAVVVGAETRDPELQRITVRRGSATSGASAPAIASTREVSTGLRLLGEPVASPFHAAPFRESMTGLDFFRNRWYSPRAGTFLTPDPMGHADSPNLYAFAGGDPVNHRDPTGLYEADVHQVLTEYLALRAGFSAQDAATIAASDVGVDRNPATKPIDNARAGKWDVVKRNHFAIHAGEKIVRRNSPTARAGVENATSLLQLGRGLHLLQDSYSHEEAYVGNIVDQGKKYGGMRLATVEKAIKNPEQGIGHPDKPAIGSRADNHLTDQTWTDPVKAIEMARITFVAMIDYRLRVGAIDAQRAFQLRQKWPRLQKSLHVFASAKTKAEKQQWLNTYAQTLKFSKEDLKDMSLENR